MGTRLISLMGVCWLWCGGVRAAEAIPKRFADMTPEQIDDFLMEQDRRPAAYTQRLLRVSEMFLGAPFADSPLGEGPGQPPDPDPLIRFDVVDCTTFVEQSMALAQVGSLKEALDLLRRIRYLDGVVDYQHRKHFMMAQWIPTNQREGFIEDITKQVGGKAVRWVSKQLDASTWSRRRGVREWPRLLPDEVPRGVFRLPIIPIEPALAFASRIPVGTLLNVVRHDLQTVPERVSHQGLVVVRGGRHCLRHAARVGYGKVVDELLDTFLRRNSAYRRWPVAGINLQRIKPVEASREKDGEK